MRHRRLWLAAIALLAVAAVLASTALLLGRAAPPQTVDAFLQQHWQRPLAPQGTPPAGFSALEASLDPRACGQCHTAQYRDWRNSLHSQTMTAGVQWQLRLLPQDQANACLDCHAPLAEQKALVAQAQQWPQAPQTPPPAYVPASLAHDGLSCAACHVRGHARAGPAPRTPAVPQDLAPHGGFTIAPAFEDSRFCGACHQFPDDGPRTAGKLREDTVRQWQASRFAAEGRTCQSCHMPDRQHRWQGIHSADMVREALHVELDTSSPGQITVKLTNTGAGHDFPTYMVPKVGAELWLVANGQGADQLLARDVIGWDVDVSLQEERFDTRIAPGASRSLVARLPQRVAPQARLQLRLQVAPREHYERTYQSVLAQADRLDADTLRLLRRAYDEAVGTRFELTLLDRPLSAVAEPAR